MPSNYFRGGHLADVKRVRQITSSHCGPAVLEMLLSKLGISVSQTQIVEASDAIGKINQYGMTLSDMAKAVDNLYPDLTFWHKFEGEIYDLRYITEVYHYPVGVEWQGEFDRQDDDEDPGHYGVVTHVDMDQEFLLIADPYYPIRDRRFKLEDFNERWWDINETKDLEKGETKKTYENHPMFVVTPKSADFPELIGMRSAALLQI